jgi:hypothetical protein
MNTKPHILFEIWRPDEVAECLDGVTDELYKKLWTFVEDFKAPRPEVAEEPTPGLDCLADFWDRLTIPEQQHLNTLAQKQDEQ